MLPLLVLLAFVVPACQPPLPAPDLSVPADQLPPPAHFDLRADLRPDLSPAPKAAILHAGDPRGATALQKQLVLLGGLSQVLVFDAGVAVPDALLLTGYDALLVYSVGPFANPDLLGDRLADFMAGGGGVVAAMLTTTAKSDPFYPNLSIGGQFREKGYYALLPDSGFRGREGAPVALGKIYEPMSPLLAGLVEFSGGIDSFRPKDPGLPMDTVRVADWADGAPLLVRKQVMGRPRVDLGFFPPPDFDHSGQNRSAGGDVLVRNALLMVARR